MMEEQYVAVGKHLPGFFNALIYDIALSLFQTW